MELIEARNTLDVKNKVWLVYTYSFYYLVKSFNGLIMAKL